jgi:hypothetical protein
VRGADEGAGISNDALEHGRLPDPEGQAIDDLARRVAELETQLKSVMQTLSDAKTATQR